ncbi:ribose/galactose ABC transporter ATP-binding protein [Spiroplasma helicoides]|uniref:Ribose/galactose ABC transporter ATP-binding protein n=2 Tax=Spiroplasma helicoides TaxID=216938 RepID=A0A1B3SKY5_9MOLU|nr:ribose/galactose ABC transporter ATP-binding protein [Spiroplasma helicoides]
MEMNNITMIFNKKIVANENITLKVKKGEIHALVGENGAGKSTLMSILFGILQPTKGSIKINGKDEIINSPIRAARLGIGMVHQHFKMVEIFKLWENIALGQEELIANEFVNSKKIKDKITKIMQKYNLEIDINKTAMNSTVGMKQKAEILKILYREADILVFDEPSAVLTPVEIKGLLDVLLELKKAGKTIILITHKMAEIKAVADSATVIRRGKLVQTFDMKSTNVDQLSEAMVGRKIVEVKNTYKEPMDKVCLKVSNLSMKKVTNPKVMGLNNFNLEIKYGEIVAIAGVEGNGQNELVNAITGMSKVSNGKIFINNIDITNASVRDRYLKYHISHIPEDRHKHGLVLDNNIINNMTLQDIDKLKFSKHKLIKQSSLQSYAQEVIDKYDVRNADFGFATARDLSGGNQQKVIVGREMSRKSDLIVIFQPTRGLDVGSIEYIHNQILKAKEEGKAILLVSYELTEIMSLADRIIVLSSGKKIGEVNGQKATIDEIGKMMLGERRNKDEIQSKTMNV